jgi:cholesterol transport system auxiliary component
MDMQRWITLLALAGSLSACLSLNGNKPQAGPQTFDFGISSPSERIATQTSIANVQSGDALNTRRIRYRLTYQNAQQVAYYADSRWTAPPAELLTQQLRNRQAPAANGNGCLLTLSLESFDHIFDSPTASHALVQINATLQQAKSRQALASRTFQVSSPAPSADAAGGVAALRKASETVISDMLSWAESQEVCH